MSLKGLPIRATKEDHARHEAQMAQVRAADVVNHPPHYKGANGMEAIDVIEAFDLSFRLGNTVKYILRAGRKSAVLEDLKKARWYLDREIEKRIEVEASIRKEIGAIKRGLVRALTKRRRK